MSREKQARTGMEIAIIGISGRFPGAKSIDRFWDNLQNGIESISFFSDEELEEAGISTQEIKNPGYVKAKGVLEDIESFDSVFFNYTPKEAFIMDPQVRLFHECAGKALENAGYDTASYDGSIGLYAGASTNYHWMVNALLFRSDSASSLFENVLLNNRDYLSTRVAYKLDLKGPGVMIQTACSTSLTAVHMAAQALLLGECEMALAGGVTVLLPQKTGYIYRDDMIFSPDGHCRAFDAQAQGFVDGNGIGILVLKRLEEAIADGDYIHALILGSAANNDGTRRVGYTAPGADGQAAVIRAARQMAEVEPESISYIETHGTGTNMGDAIEIEALKRAFHTTPGNHTTAAPAKHYCALGSVKTNLGHLDAAAGAAGLIKTVLALKHRMIPPSLNFTTPNPKLGLENSPFYINHRLTPWRGGQFPLRAGVSSFGIGGTNVHVILEEAPGGTRGLAPLINEDTSRKYQLILLSAKTKPALERMTKNLGEYLQQNPGINLPNVAYTLQEGRSAFTHRRMLVGADCKEAVHALLNPDSGAIRDHFTKKEDRPVVFMFPGLGSQYVNMGLDLYRRESLFREETDRCFEIVNGLVDYDIKEILYPSPVSSVAKKIDQTETAQMVIFIFEYALAKLLMHWGIKPYAMIGYSFGEYTAACISGVLSLEDALKVIKARGQLIRRIPTGAMLSVPLPEEKLKPLLSGELSIAIDNGVSCVVSGSYQAIDTLEKQMKEKKYVCVRLVVSHAIHSLMMESILEEFAAAVGEVTLNKPQIPYISNVTGNWITIEDAGSPRYWVNHLRETVRFAHGLEELVKKESVVLVEVGPGVVLSTLAVRHIDKKSDQLVVNLLRSEEQKVSDVEYLLRKIGRLWLYGKKIDWSGFYPGEKRHRIPLPTYSFDARYYSVDVSHLRGLLEGKLPKAEGLEMEMETESQPTDPEAGYVAPRDNAEQIIVDMWEEILGIKPIGIQDNFFEMGGDSLKGITFINKFKEMLGEIMHITVMFDAPTVAELSAYLTRNYPQSYSRVKGNGDEEKMIQKTGQNEEGVTLEKIERTRHLIPLLTPMEEIDTPGNPPVVFILSPPRTGSTLLRVLLGGHPKLFAPPELNLLGYGTLQERKAANSGHAVSHLQGTIRAIMQVKECSIEEAQAIIRQYEEQELSVRQFYCQLQEWIGDRVLVDKSPGYAINPHTLKRAEVYFQDPLYIHLLRHPYGMIRSYMEAKLDLLMDRQTRDELSYSRRELAELSWTISEQNITAFLKNIPAERQLCIKFEDLVAHPGVIIKDICKFLHLEFHPGMLQPYKEKKQRMTDGVYSQGIMLGDMKFHRHKGIDPNVADTWKSDYTVDFLGEPTLEIAKFFGYKTIRELKNKTGETEDIIPGFERSSARQLLSTIDKFSDEEVDLLLNEMLAKNGAKE
jgi:phthiocerol/phenolphthiocerol synthesis type-I polyketide synthase E